MEVAAKLKGAQISAQKVRLVADQVRGLRVEEALGLLEFSSPLPAPSPTTPHKFPQQCQSTEMSALQLVSDLRNDSRLPLLALIPLMRLTLTLTLLFRS